MWAKTHPWLILLFLPTPHHPTDRCRYFTTKRKGSSKKHQRGWEGKNSNDEGESTNLLVNQQRLVIEPRRKQES